MLGVVAKFQICLIWNFGRICHGSRDINISGFGSYVAISGCRLVLQSLADTFCDLSMVVNPRFDVEISIVSHSFTDISISGFGSHFRLLASPKDIFFELA